MIAQKQRSDCRARNVRDEVHSTNVIVDISSVGISAEGLAFKRLSIQFLRRRDVGDASTDHGYANHVATAYQIEEERQKRSLCRPNLIQPDLDNTTRLVYTKRPRGS